MYDDQCKHGDELSWFLITHKLFTFLYFHPFIMFFFFFFFTANLVQPTPVEQATEKTATTATVGKKVNIITFIIKKLTI